MSLTTGSTQHTNGAARAITPVAPIMTSEDVEGAYRTCVRTTRQAAANFYYGISLLPRPKRWAMSAVYAFSRRVDDIG
ncbi:MAG TPA: squalene/phytoene synthase family protein, partial [Solirubrobacteraceae bacterium]|nr:squalene/phytoene synthase family protein [Solirubrobacteraceae bacterium]